MGYLIMSVSEELLSLLAGIEQPQVAWERLVDLFVKKSTERLALLYQEFDKLQIEPKEAVMQLGGRTIGVRTQNIQTGGSMGAACTRRRRQR